MEDYAKGYGISKNFQIEKIHSRHLSRKEINLIYHEECILCIISGLDDFIGGSASNKNVVTAARSIA
jgi:hypothetical protein